MMNGPLTSEQWLKEKLHIDLTKDNEREMSCFLLLWILFERKVLKTNGRRVSKAIIDKAPTIQVDFQPILGIIRDWYITGKKEGLIFTLFSFDSRILKQSVESYLDNSDTTDENVQRFVIAIIYQYRCNLFHGEKDLSSVANTQADRFKAFNIFLTACLNTVRDL
jgi:hypothetical protein